MQTSRPVEKNTRLFHLFLAKAEACLASYDIEGAIKASTLALKNSDNKLDSKEKIAFVYCLRGKAYFMQGFMGEFNKQSDVFAHLYAMKDFNAAFELDRVRSLATQDANDRYLYWLQRLVREAIPSKPGQSFVELAQFAEHLFVGTESYLNGDYDDCLRRFEGVIKHFEWMDSLILMRCRAMIRKIKQPTPMHQLGFFAPFIYNDLQILNQKQPGNPQYYFLLSEVQMVEQAYEKAFYNAKKVLECDRNDDLTAVERQILLDNIVTLREKLGLGENVDAAKKSSSAFYEKNAARNFDAESYSEATFDHMLAIWLVKVKMDTAPLYSYEKLRTNSIYYLQKFALECLKQGELEQSCDAMVLLKASILTFHTDHHPVLPLRYFELEEHFKNLDDLLNIDARENYFLSNDKYNKVRNIFVKTTAKMSEGYCLLPQSLFVLSQVCYAMYGREMIQRYLALREGQPAVAEEYYFFMLNKIPALATEIDYILESFNKKNGVSSIASEPLSPNKLKKTANHFPNNAKKKSAVSLSEAKKQFDELNKKEEEMLAHGREVLRLEEEQRKAEKAQKDREKREVKKMQSLPFERVVSSDTEPDTSSPSLSIDSVVSSRSDSEPMLIEDSRSPSPKEVSPRDFNEDANFGNVEVGTIEVPSAVIFAMKKLIEAGFSRTYLVGGFLRDSLRKKLYGIDFKANDFDISTEATLEDIKQVFKGLRITILFNSVRIHLDNGIELDVHSSLELANRNHTAELARYRDASLRDFTINTFYLNWQCYVEDPLHQAMFDLQNSSSLEVIGDPLVSFNWDAKAEIKGDPVRMLRFIYYMTSLKLSAANPTIAKAILQNRGSLVKYVQADMQNAGRVNSWLHKLLCSANGLTNLNALCVLGLLEALFPGLPKKMESDSRIQNVIHNASGAKLTLNYIYNLFRSVEPSLHNNVLIKKCFDYSPWMPVMFPYPGARNSEIPKEPLNTAPVCAARIA